MSYNLDKSIFDIFQSKKGNNSAVLGAIKLVIELDRDIMPIYTPTKFHKVELKTVRVIIRTK